VFARERERLRREAEAAAGKVVPIHREHNG